MPDVFWAGLFTSIGTLAGGAIGWMTTRHQLGIREQEVALERRRLENNDEYRFTELGDKRAGRRREVYLRYLKGVDDIVTPAETGTLTGEGLHGAWGSFLDAHNEVELVGDGNVNDAAYALNEVVEELYGEFARIVAEQDSDSVGADGAVGWRAERLRKARRKVVARMREDLESE